MAAIQVQTLALLGWYVLAHAGSRAYNIGRSMGSTMRLEGHICFKRVIMHVDGTIPWAE